jgi:hypothetical protein
MKGILSTTKKNGVLHPSYTMLQIKIAEVMCHDLKHGYESNAECGFQLMV